MKGRKMRKIRGCDGCEDGSHILHFRPRGATASVAEVCLVDGPTPRHVYLWLGDSSGKPAGVIRGVAGLETIADAINAAFGVLNR